MLSVIKFILDSVIKLMSMLFTINIGDGLNLGLLMCLVFIFLPIMLRIISFLKRDALEEINDDLREQKFQRLKSNNKQRRSR